MQKFLQKLITLLEVVIGVALLFGGVTGFFSYFLFNVLIGVMGFFILLDGLEKVDAPQTPSQPEQHHHGGGQLYDDVPYFTATGALYGIYDSCVDSFYQIHGNKNQAPVQDS